MRRSVCRSIGAPVGRVLTLDPEGVRFRVPRAECAKCGHRLDVAQIVRDAVLEAIRNATTGEIVFPHAGEFEVVANYSDGGRMLSIQIMTR